MCYGQGATCRVLRATCTLEQHFHGELHLPRIAHAGAQEPVEIEQRRRGERVDIVVVVERVEHLDDRYELQAVAEAERPRQPPVEREERVVLALAVAAAILAVEAARACRDRLRRAALNPGAELEAAAKSEGPESVHLVPDVAVGWTPVEIEVEEIEAAVGERIALVRIVVLVLREHVI